MMLKCSLIVHPPLIFVSDSGGCMPLKRHLLIDVCRSLEILITYSREVSYSWRITKSRAIRVSITSGASALTKKYSGGLRGMDLSRVCVANDGSHVREGNGGERSVPCGPGRVLYIPCMFSSICCWRCKWGLQ